jgi:phosphoribosyl-AMP cyclohydrolase
MAELQIRFDDNGLLPVVVQDDESNEVLMMAFMNREALELTRKTGEVHFWSRSRAQLWRKGETSGHIQRVRSIHINCNEDSLLIRAEQVGACCHTGYATCYYRELDADGSTTVHGERLFNPEMIYGRTNLADQIRRWVGAYYWLADHDLGDVSGTSRMLHLMAPDYPSARVMDELSEVAGVVLGTHRHASPVDDVILETGQALYWIVTTAILLGADRAELAAQIAHKADDPGDETQSDIAALLNEVARAWAEVSADRIGDLIDSTVPLLVRACEQMQATLAEAINRDLDEMRAKSYLEQYFASATA